MPAVCDVAGDVAGAGAGCGEGETVWLTPHHRTQEAFGQRFSVVRYENGASFVFSSTVQSDDDVLFFMIWSDEGDSVPFLKRQLQLLSELILFKYGPHVNVRTRRNPA